MTNRNTIKAICTVLILLLPQLVLASNLIVSTVNNDDPYNNNQSWFKYNQSAGSAIKDSLILRNIGNQKETVKLYATDATSNQSGSFISKQESDTQKNLGIWTKLELNEVTLEPSQTIYVNFVINIPADATPGEYFGSIIKEDKTNALCNQTQTALKTEHCSSNLQIKTRTGNRIYLNIPGQTIEDIHMSDFKYTQTSDKEDIFKFSFINKGNISFSPKVIINIYDLFGKKVDSIDSILGLSMPGTTIEPTLLWKKDGKIGKFKADINITYLQEDFGSINNLHNSPLGEKREISFFLIPWTSLITVIILLLAVIIILFIRKRIYQNMISNCTNHLVIEDENIMKIAEKYDQDWQMIAKINKLKAPYILIKDQRLKIPKQK